MSTLATSSSPNRGQGHSTATILTNRARDITVISDVSFKDRKTPLAPDSPPKGSRQMHRTTLTFDRQPPKMDYLTSSFSAFSGSKSLGPVVRPLPCPSLHSSHFDFGITREKFYRTHHKANYYSKETRHPNENHYPSLVNSSFNTRGADMQDVLARRNWKPNYWSSYTDVHDRLGLERGPGEPRPAPVNIRHNILNGWRIGPEIPQDHHRISGNRHLYNTHRRENQEYFALG